MKNRIKILFEQKKDNIISIFFTAGYPKLRDTTEIIKQLDLENVDLIEIGMPFSDPVADGPLIQNSSKIAIENGMSIRVLLEQLKEIRKHTQIPLVLMGYINPIIRYGETRFFEDISKIGIDGLIIPDMPLSYYIERLKPYYTKYNISYIGLISPTTTKERVHEIDAAVTGFLYIVSNHGITGSNRDLSAQRCYFERIQSYSLKNPSLIGFGIHNLETLKFASNYSQGVIIGSAFIQSLSNSDTLVQNINTFIKPLKL